MPVVAVDCFTVQWALYMDGGGKVAHHSTAHPPSVAVAVISAPRIRRNTPQFADLSPLNGQFELARLMQFLPSPCVGRGKDILRAE